MEDFYMNNTSQNNNDHYSNITFYNYNYNYSYYSYYSYFVFPEFVVTCTIITIGVPLTLMAIYALFSQVRKDHVAPIYVINLLISDLIQFCCMIVEVVRPDDLTTGYIFFQIYNCSLLASVGFMVCVALERYLVIACPLWYRFRRTIKISVLVCVVVWVVPLVYIFPSVLGVQHEVFHYIFAVFCLLPFPLLIFFLGGTLRALSATTSVPTDEKRRIVGMLVLVLLIYTLLFLPGIIWLLIEHEDNEILYYLSSVFFKLSPLADLVLYVFMRKGAIDRLLASVCCCRMDSNDSRSPAVSVVTTCPQSA